jgi:Tol biopolymer transport system component
MTDIRVFGRAALAAAGLVALAGAAAPARAGSTERVSVSSSGVTSSGQQGNGSSELPSISAGGRFVAFVSNASNLVLHDTNGFYDVFVRDRLNKVTERVSVGPHRTQSNDSSSYPVISADGQFVAFQSDATNLVPHDTNGRTDVFVRDRKLGTTERVSISSAGEQGNGDSFVPVISADGRFVAFDSNATNLVPHDTNGVVNIFVRDRKLGRTERVSVGPHGVQADKDSPLSAISAHGRFVAFWSFATNLVPHDTNGQDDVFVRTR